MDINPKKVVVEAKSYKILTYSNISMFLDCPMKYYLRNIVKVVPVDKSKALTMGSIYHDAIDMYFKSAVRPIDTVVMGTVMDYIKNQCMENSKYLESNEDVILQGMVQGFIHHFSKMDLKIIDNETLFDKPLKGFPNHHICGKRDAKLRKDKQVFFGEWKTATRIDTYVKMIQTSNQANQYFWGFEEEEPVGMIFCIAKKSELRLSKGETIEKYRARIIDDYLNRPEANFHNEIVFVDQVKLARWKHELTQITERIDQFEKTNSWYRNTGSCWNYNTLCPYHKLCEATNAKLFDEIKAAYYVEREPGEELFTVKE